MLYNTWCKFYFTMSIPTACAKHNYPDDVPVDQLKSFKELTDKLADLLLKYKEHGSTFGGALTLNTGDHVFIISVTENVPTLNVCQANKS